MLILRKEAEEDIQQAFDWYESQRSGLGSTYLAELEQVLEHIQEQPQRYPPVQNSLRRALCRRFPYAIYYLHQDSRVTVLAVMHQMRHPMHWQNRGEN
jgi:toxin ParE1/3/4